MAQINNDQNKKKTKKPYIWVKKPIFVAQDLMQYNQNSFWYGEHINLFYRKEFLSSAKNN